MRERNKNNDDDDFDDDVDDDDGILIEYAKHPYYLRLLVLKFVSYLLSLSFKFARFNFAQLVNTYSRSFQLARVIFRVRPFWFL